MASTDSFCICVEVWKGTPVAAAALAGLTAAVIESPSRRHRRRPRTAAALAACAAGLFIACGALAASAHPLAGVLVFAGAIAASAEAVWLLRGAGHGRGGGGGGGGRRPDLPPIDLGPGGIDWDAFERDFAAYADARSRVMVP